MMEWNLNTLTREDLQKVILKMTELLSEEQCRNLQILIEEYKHQKTEKPIIPDEQPRMSQALVDEKMKQIENLKQQIDEGELYLDIEEYEDYSGGYWDSEWITEYYDNQGIGEKIMSVIRFAKDCVDDRRYQKANLLYEWLWEIAVCTYSEYGDSDNLLDLEELAENKIISTDMRQLALLTLYTDYQALEPEKRVEDIYLYFSYSTFRKLHIEEMFHVGRENLTNTEQFWQDWMELLKTKSGDAEGRLLKEAILYCKGTEGLVQMADENAAVHPSLYLAAMAEYEKEHDYVKMEKVGEKALEKIDKDKVIRGEAALKAAYASSCLYHEEQMMQFCWECYYSDSTDRNFLRLFGTKEMAERYRLRGKEAFTDRIKGNQQSYVRNSEHCPNIMGDFDYYTLSFYAGDFEKVKAASKNPNGSLGWSSSFIRYGIRLFLLYLYEKTVPSRAALSIADVVGFHEEKNTGHTMKFEEEIIAESHEHKVSVFWNYFQRWKMYFPMEQQQRTKYLSWAEKNVYARADAIVAGQHRNQYAEVAILLAMVGEIKESMGLQGARREIFSQYKRKFPRHSSFQSQMKTYFNEW